MPELDETEIRQHERYTATAGAARSDCHAAAASPPGHRGHETRRVHAHAAAAIVRARKPARCCGG
jgi:hypothetical protein